LCNKQDGLFRLNRGAASSISESGLICNWNNQVEKKFHIDSQQEILGFPFRDFISMTPIPELIIALTRIRWVFPYGWNIGYPHHHIQIPDHPDEHP
jgi:hypothetical protein